MIQMSPQQQVRMNFVEVEISHHIIVLAYPDHIPGKIQNKSYDEHKID